MIDKKEIDKSIPLWLDFQEKLINESRFFLKHDVIDHIKRLASENVLNLQKGSKFYRAIIYNDESYINIPEIFLEYTKIISDKNNKNDLHQRFKKIEVEKKLDIIKSNFLGYQKGKNLMPSKYTYESQGRANPQYIPYLYLADLPYTALAEIKPTLQSKVSISEIVCKKDLNIIDFSLDAKDINKESLLHLIMIEFSEPFQGSLKQYITTQYISEYIKSEGFDGIKFDSSLNPGGRNYIFYNDKNFEDMNSYLYEVKSAYLIAESINNQFDSKKICPETLKDLLKAKEDRNKPLESDESGLTLKEAIDRFLQNL